MASSSSSSSNSLSTDSDESTVTDVDWDPELGSSDEYWTSGDSSSFTSFGSGISSPKPGEGPIPSVLLEQAEACRFRLMRFCDVCPPPGFPPKYEGPCWCTDRYGWPSWCGPPPIIPPDVGWQSGGSTDVESDDRSSMGAF